MAGGLRYHQPEVLQCRFHISEMLVLYLRVSDNCSVLRHGKLCITVVLPSLRNARMPRLFAVACRGIIALLISAIAFPRAAAAQKGGVTVGVDIRCNPNNGVSFNVEPWSAQLAQGDTIAWQLNTNANAPDITITSKQTDWPFTTSPPYKGNAAKPPKVKGMKPNQQVGKHYAYAITAVCTRADGTTNTVVIDPDMIIVHFN